MKTDPNDATRPKSKRHRLQFSLRALLALVTLWAVGLSWVAVKIQHARRHRDAVLALRARRAEVSLSDEYILPEWLRRLLGDETQYAERVDFRELEHAVRAAEEWLEGIQESETRCAEQMAVLRREAESVGFELGLDNRPITEDDLEALNMSLKLRLESLRDAKSQAWRQHFDRILGAPRKGGSDSNAEEVPFGSGDAGQGDPFRNYSADILDSFDSEKYDEPIFKIQALLRKCAALRMELEHFSYWPEVTRDLDELRSIGLEFPWGKSPESQQRRRALERMLAELKDRQIGDDDLALLEPLTKLRRLDHPGPNVTDAGVEHLQGLKELRSLDLSGTAVTDAGLAHLAGLTNLETLDLTGCNVTDTGLEHLKECTKLKYLLLDHTRVAGAALAHLKNCAELRVLQLANTQVRDPALAHLRNFPKLSVLVLDGTYVGDAGLRHLRAVPDLGRLQLMGTEVTDAGLAHLVALPKLRTLYLQNNRITDAGVRHLKNLPEGTNLHIAATEVTDTGLAQLEGTPLRSLSVSAPCATEQGVERLQKTMPECDVDLRAWSVPPGRFLDRPVRLVAARSSAAEQWSVFHLEGRGVRLFLCLKPGRTERFFTNVYLVRNLQQPRTTKFNCVPRHMSDYFAQYPKSALGSYGYDVEQTTAQDMQTRIRQEHDDELAGHLIALWECWKELVDHPTQ